LQFCVIPLQRFLRAELRDRIGGALAYRPEPGKPLAIAGLWRAWAEPEGTAFSFTTLTINSDEHPLMRRFHKPGAEKRSVVILRPEQYDDWLGCRTTDEARSFLNLFPADEMAATPAPIPPRRRKSQAGETDSLL
jgi:putative SOS response-associated peptidase YedK